MSQIFKSSTSPGAPIKRLTGNSGGAVSPDSSGNITFTASGGFSVTGTPGSNSLDMAPTGFATGSILFASSATSFGQDNANLFFNDTTNNMGVGTNTTPFKFNVLDTNPSLDGSAEFTSSHSVKLSYIRTKSAVTGYAVDYGVRPEGGSFQRVVRNIPANDMAFEFSHNNGSLPLGRFLGNGNFAIGNITPVSTLVSSGNLSVGTSYTGTAAPTNGAIIEGAVGIGLSSLSTGLLLEVGGVISSNTQFAYGYLGDIGAARMISELGGFQLTFATDNSTSSGIAFGTRSVLAATWYDGWKFDFVTLSFFVAGDVGIGTDSPASASVLEVVSTTKGVRFPNMTETQRDNIATPVAGLVIYNTTSSKLNVYTSAWEAITSA